VGSTSLIHLPTHSAVVCGLSVLLIAGLSMYVSRVRLRHQVFLGDGDVKELQVAIRAHGNAVEHLMPLLLLLVVYELLGARKILVDMFGLAIITARVCHAVGYLRRAGILKQAGVALTYATEAALGLMVILKALVSV
jgi:uncharacterized membrane protein YecN with MAPEG domain